MGQWQRDSQQRSIYYALLNSISPTKVRPVLWVPQCTIHKCPGAGSQSGDGSMPRRFRFPYWRLSIPSQDIDGAGGQHTPDQSAGSLFLD